MKLALHAHLSASRRATKYLIATTSFLSLFTLTQTAIAYPIEAQVGFASGTGWTDTEFSDPAVDDFGAREIPSYTDVKNPNLPWSVYAGLRFHPNYGVELAYVSYPRIEFEKTLEKRDNNNGEVLRLSVRDASIHASGLSLSHVFYLPLFWNIDLAAKAGVFLGDVQYNDDETLQQQQDAGNGTEFVTYNSSDSSEKSLSTVNLALAASWRASKEWSTRLQVEQISFKHDEEKEKFTQWYSSFAIQYHF